MNRKFFNSCQGPMSGLFQDQKNQSCGLLSTASNARNLIPLQLVFSQLFAGFAAPIVAPARRFEQIG